MTTPLCVVAAAGLKTRHDEATCTGHETFLTLCVSPPELLLREVLRGLLVDREEAL